LNKILENDEQISKNEIISLFTKTNSYEIHMSQFIIQDRFNSCSDVRELASQFITGYHSETVVNMIRHVQEAESAVKYPDRFVEEKIGSSLADGILVQSILYPTTNKRAVICEHALLHFRLLNYLMVVF
jgi:hypothetical protein